MFITFDLPYPPSANTYWRSVPYIVWKDGKPSAKVRVLISASGQAFRAKALAFLNKQGIALKRTAKRIKMRIDSYPPDRRQRDVDNLQKPTLDVLEFWGVYDNDSQVRDLRTVMHDPVRGGYITITIKEFNP